MSPDVSSEPNRPEETSADESQTCLQRELFQRALTAHQVGQTEQARLLYETVLSHSPHHPEALHYLGALLLQTGSSKQAVGLISSAIRIRPDYAEAYVNLGLALQSEQRLEDSIVCFTNAIRISPDFIEAHFKLGYALQKASRWDEALAQFANVLRLNSAHFLANFQSAQIHHHLNQPEAALQRMDAALSSRPEHASAWCCRGVYLLQLSRYAEAIVSFDAAIRFNPGLVEAHANRGTACQMTGRFMEAVSSFDAAIALDGQNSEFYYNRGNAPKELQRFGEAFFSYERALALKPEHALVKWNYALGLLLTGDFQRGWALYETRIQLPSLNIFKSRSSQPMWSGQTNLQGKTILLYAEQGLGDTLQFSRFARCVKSLGARVVIEVQDPLVTLLQTLDGVDLVVGRTMELPEHDLQCSLMSLPFALGIRLDTIPQSVPYLETDSIRQQHWQARINSRQDVPDSLRVGIVWSGRSTHANDANRSLDLKTLLPNLPPNLSYVSLQKEIRAADREMLDAAGILHFGEDLNDFADTAALCACMDLVVSVDTSVAHLAGALGRPAHVLLPYTPDFRWLLGCATSPWYPTVTLRRQGEDRDWSPVLESLRLFLQSCG